MECLAWQKLINDLLCRPCWFNVCVHPLLLTKESEKNTTVYVANKTACFYNVLIRKFPFVSQRNKSEISSFIDSVINLVKDTFLSYC